VHEFSLARSIQRIAVDEAGQHGASRVVGVTVRVGVLRQVVPALLQTAFDALNAGTPLAGAVLRMELSPVRIACADCGRINTSMEVATACPSCASSCIAISEGMNMDVTCVSIASQETDFEQGTDHESCSLTQSA
jgi:hydrogenase nickel incorporation protein HypA/HybF